MGTLRAARRDSRIARETYVGVRADSLPEVGEQLAGKYRIERVIGRGAMGAVFAASDEILGRHVALKLMSREHADTPESVSRFVNEARAAARIESEHVARILDVSQTDDGSPFIVLELLEGADLAQIVEAHGPQPVSEVVGWILQGLEAVAEAHSLGIVHRDLKPANLFLAQRRDGTRVVKVLDFGISKDRGTASASPRLTTTASILGSPAYMAPEQLRDARTVDARADIWGMGVALYELLTGRLPFRADNVADLFVAILESELEPVRSLRKDAPAALDDVVSRCLARDPDQRFRDVGALADALAPFAPPGDDAAARRIHHTLQAAAGSPADGRRPARVRRRRLRTVVTLVTMACLAAVAAASVASELRPNPTGTSGRSPPSATAKTH
jgi:serine/threonine-protein kinase